jgi:bacterioferritin
MKGNKKLLEKLNSLLADELTAINQYMVHSEMNDNWGYQRLHHWIEGRAVTEMKHAEKLIGRILFLEGTPVVTTLREIRIGPDVPKQLDSDLKLEHGAVRSYNEAVRLAVEVGDNASRELLESILKDEDQHVNEIEERKDQVGQTGLQIFLGHQIRKEE